MRRAAILLLSSLACTTTAADPADATTDGSAADGASAAASSGAGLDGSAGEVTGNAGDDASTAAPSETTGGPAAISATIVFPPPAVTVAATITVRGRASAPTAITAVRVAGIDATSDDGFATWRAVVPLASGDNTLAVDVDTAEASADGLAEVALVRADDWATAARGEASRFGEVYDGIYAGAEAIAYDPAGARVLVVDDWGDGVYAIEVATGDHVTISYSEAGDLLRGSGPEMTSPDAGELFADLDRMLVTDTTDPACGSCQGLFSIDLASGDRSVLAGFPGDDPVDVVVDPATGDALVLGYVDGSLWRIDPASGAGTRISGPGLGQGAALANTTAMDLDAARGRVIVSPQYRDELAAIDVVTGDRSTLSPAGTPGASFGDPRRLTIMPATDELYMLEAAGGPETTRVVAIALADGGRRELALATDDGMDPVPVTGLADGPHGLWVMSGYALFALDPITGEKVAVSR